MPKKLSFYSRMETPKQLADRLLRSILLVLASREVAIDIASNATTTEAFKFYERWRSAQTPETQAILDAYDRCKIEAVAAMLRPHL
jgi:hypothetical protein